MEKNQNKAEKKIANPRGDHELLWVVITALVLVGLFWVPKGFWLGLNFFLFFAVFHYLALRTWKQRAERQTIVGFLWFLGPIYAAFIIGLIVLWQRGNLNW